MLYNIPYSKSKGLFSILLLLTIVTNPVLAQQKDQDEKYTPYELLSSYYNKDFKPFGKRNVYIGLSFSLEDRNLSNTDFLLQRVIDGERLDYNIVLKSGYYTGNYGMVGLNVNYYQSKFDGDVFRDPDTLRSNRITRGFAITPNFRSSVPLTNNERLSFFTELGFTIGRSNSLTRETMNLDEINKIYSTDYNFRLGLSPGITFFVMEAFAFEVQLDVLGYELKIEEKTTNNEDSSRELRQNVDFNINLLSLRFGLAYYFGAKNIKN
ncbi:hypothetical protein DCC35_12205 [Mangrovivirga cuniculi]|uniref:Outer membrane protein beta-barrel domain-containing protein n=2 Tax=Mangrovivirga cuniculi TaxID=2715131 RepID=A0A4D7JPN2_9BACT|nr:hypothetical protein DCC35_12205 [Mangrovivirga cuniculi]